MQQTCSKCGSVTMVPSKFCRNCGAPFPNEGQATEAPTRQYGRQTPGAEVPPTSSPFTGPGQPPPPSVADAFAADTARLHGQQGAPPSGQPYGQSHGQPYGQPPMPAAYQPGPLAGNPVPYPMQSPPKSNWWKWLLGIVLMTILVCGGLIGYGVKRASDAVPDVQKQIEAAIAEAQKEAERAAKEAGVPSLPPGAPPPPLPPGQSAVTSLDQLRYPKSEEMEKTEVFGQQILTLKTSDNVDTVRAYYEKKLGRAPIESNKQGQKAVVFMQKPYMVSIGTEGGSAGQTTITLIRSGLIPQINPQQ
jgi:hypothetical protein